MVHQKAKGNEVPLKWVSPSLFSRLWLRIIPLFLVDLDLHGMSIFPKTLNIFDDHVVHFDHFVRFTCGKRKRRWNSWWCSHYAASQCIGWLWAAEQNTRLLYRRGDTHELGWLAQWPWFGFCTSSTKSSVHQRIEHKYCHCCTRPWEAQWWQLCELYCSGYRSSRTALRSLTASLELDTKAVGVFREPILGENFHPWKRRRAIITRWHRKKPTKTTPKKRTWQSMCPTFPAISFAPHHDMELVALSRCTAGYCTAHGRWTRYTSPRLGCISSPRMESIWVKRWHGRNLAHWKNTTPWLAWGTSMTIRIRAKNFIMAASVDHSNNWWNGWSTTIYMESHTS